MSALGGLCHWDGRPVVRERLSLLAQYLHVAGPHSAEWVQPMPWLALQAHTLHFDRLSTLEQQPYRFTAGSVLTWDGRLDNRDDLLLRVHRAVGDDESDAAIVAAAYDRWGLESLSQLIGDWALAVWDAPLQRLVLARDYMGNRPLYYRSDGDGLAWATRLEALAAVEELFGQPDDLYLASYLATIPNPNDSTPFTGILRLLPGHVLISTRNGLSVRRYWRYSPTVLRHGRPEEHAEQLRHLLTEAVRVRMRSTRTVWCHLSGGWDSSTVTCLAHRMVTRRLVEAPALQPLTLLSGDPEESEERSFVASVERWCDLTTTLGRYRGRAEFEDLQGLRILIPTLASFEMEAPVQAAGDYVVLTGSMGDMLTGKTGGLLPLWESFEHLRLRDGVRSLLLYAHKHKRPVGRLFLSVLGARLTRESTISIGPPISERQAAAIGAGIAPELIVRGLSRRSPTPAPFDEFPRMRQSLVRSLYRHADRGTSASPEHYNPVIWRTHPYLHRPLVEFLLAVPTLTMFDAAFPRAAMKRALTDILPPTILERATKIGIGMTTYARTQQRQIERFLETPPLIEPPQRWRLVQRGVVDADKVADRVRVMNADRKPSDFLFRCIDLEAWLRSLDAPSRTATPFASVPNQPTSERPIPAASEDRHAVYGG